MGKWEAFVTLLVIWTPLLYYIILVCEHMKPLSKEFLISRGECCGNRCINCPYTKPHRKGNKQYEDYIKSEGQFRKDGAGER